MISSPVAADDGPDAPAAQQWVIFACGGGRFGFPLGRVAEILAPRAFTRMPGAGPEVCGLIGVRGRIITVFDLGIVLGGGRAAGQPDHRLLLLELDGRQVAGVADDVLAIEPAGLEAGPAQPPGVPEGAVLGMGSAEAGGFVALDPVVLLARLLQ